MEQENKPTEGKPKAPAKAAEAPAEAAVPAPEPAPAVVEAKAAAPAKAGAKTAAPAKAPPKASAPRPRVVVKAKPPSGGGKPLDPTGRGGTASIFAGVAIIAPVLIRELTTGSDPYLLLPITLIILAVALGGLRVAQGGKDGKMGRIGVLMAAGGAVVLTIMLLAVAYADVVKNSQLQRGTSIIDISFYVLVVGIVLFGAASLQAGVLARGPMLLFMIAVPLGIFFDSVGAFANRRPFQWGPSLGLGAGLHLGLKIMGLALIWMGYSILKTTKSKVDATKAEVKAG